MRALLAVMLFAGAPFWESKFPDQWTSDELAQMLHASPWAKAISLHTAVGDVPAVQVFLASARPVQDAEEELKRRLAKGKPAEDEGENEFRAFLRENQGKYIVLAVALRDPKALADTRESKRMEEECLLRVGKAKYKISGLFPPVPSDRFLRLIFPRAVGPGDKTLRFELYLPSVPAPYRTVEFDVKDLVYKGRVEM